MQGPLVHWGSKWLATWTNDGAGNLTLRVKGGNLYFTFSHADINRSLMLCSVPGVFWFRSFAVHLRGGSRRRVQGVHTPHPPLRWPIQLSNTTGILRNKKQINVSFLCVCPVIDHEFHHHIVKVALDPRGDSPVDPQTSLTMWWRNSWSITGQTHKKLTSICFLR